MSLAHACDRQVNAALDLASDGDLVAAKRILDSLIQSGADLSDTCKINTYRTLARICIQMTDELARVQCGEELLDLTNELELYDANAWTVLFDLSSTYVRQQQYSAAEAILNRLLGLANEIPELPKRNALQADMLLALAGISRDRQQLDEAKGLLRQYAELYADVPDDHATIALGGFIALAEVAYELKDYNLAITAWERSLNISIAAHVPFPDLHADILDGYIAALRAEGFHDRAQKMQRELDRNRK
ncbi:MAG: hypothetical protein D6816_07885 [Bacteroidetes bacterium]|nr:MAG: hypothetical protein D6816_07885 [Bacteroidota bacterium]